MEAPERRDDARAPASHEVASLARVWTTLVARAVTYQSAILLVVVYFVVIGPSVAIGRVFRSRLLNTGRLGRTSYWEKRELEDRGPDWLLRQY